MRMMTIAICFLALFCVSLTAQTEGPKKKDRRARIIEKFDKNGDGKLDKAERKAMREAGEARRKKRQEEGKKKGDRRRRAKRKAKKDGKGKGGDDVTGQDDKKGKGRRGRRGKREELKKRFDKNGDGKLDKSERAELRKAMRRRGVKKKDTPIK